MNINPIDKTYSEIREMGEETEQLFREDVERGEKDLGVLGDQERLTMLQDDLRKAGYRKEMRR